MRPSYATILLILLSSLLIRTVSGQQQQEEIDVLHYKIEAELIPDSNLLSANAAVTFRTPQPTQSAVFEMNGSLKISKITSEGRELQFVQDTLDGLNVRIDLGTPTTAGQEVTLNFKYEGRLSSPAGGVLPNRRLAYVGAEGSYLTYAARWFPFHGYAADAATYDISLITPEGYTAVGFSTEEPKVTPYEPPPPPTPPNPEKPKPTPKRPAPKRIPSKSNFLSESVERVQDEPSVVLRRQVSTFISRIPVLPGTFAIARYKSEKTNAGGTSLEVYYKPGSEEAVSRLLEEIVEAFNFYSEKFGEYAFGKRMVVAEIDNESLETYTTAGTMLIANKTFSYLQADTIYRETAYQWWGQAVMLKSFDDAWISQGLAQYSSMMLQEERMPPAAFSEVARGYMERALAFEQQSSIRRAPATLDDQSEAYRSIVFYKGAFIYRMLQIVMGREKFQEMLKTFYREYKGRQAAIADFEKIASKVYGSDLRYFFGHWVDSTGVPEFNADYQILKTRDGSYKVRGTLSQTSESFRMPVDLEVTFEGGTERVTLNIDGEEADFNIPLKGMPKDLIVDPENKLLKISDAIRVSVVVRRGIEHFRNEEFPEAEQQFQAAIKLYRYSSWAWYNLGLLYFEQKNYQKALDTFAEAQELDLQPRWVEVWSYIKRGQCYDALGNRDRAVAEYNKAAQTGDNYEGAQEEVKKYLAAPYRPK